jgi:hypothetical protein
LNNDFFLCRGENETVENIAAAVVAGRANVDYVPASAGAGLPLPVRECPNCEGTVWLINSGEPSTFYYLFHIHKKF